MRIRTRRNPRTERRNTVWLALLILLANAAIPLGGNRPLAWSAITLWVSVLLSAWAIGLARGQIDLVWRKALYAPLAMILIVIGWIIVTTVPGLGPPHPAWQMASEQLGRPLSASISLSRDATLISLMRLVAYLSVFWLSFQYCRDRERAEQLLIWISWSGLGYALYGLINYFAGNPYLLWFERWASPDDVTATFVNRNHYATYAALGMICAVGIAINAFRSAWRLSDRSQPTFARTIECLAGRPLVYYTVALVIGMAWLQTHSRMGGAAGLLGLTVLFVLMMAVGMIRQRILLLAVLALAGLFLVQVSGAGTLTRLELTSELDRLPVFAITSEQIGSAPLTGSGYGSFAQAFQIYRDEGLVSGLVFREAHNTYLELAAELGLPAAAMLLLAALTCVALCLIGVITRSKGRLFGIVAVAASAVVAVHALLDFSLQIPANALLYASLLGMGVAQSWSIEQAASRSKTDSAVPRKPHLEAVPTARRKPPFCAEPSGRDIDQPTSEDRSISEFSRIEVAASVTATIARNARSAPA